MSGESVKSAERVIEVLKVFAKFQTPLSQKALVDETGYPQSSLVALLKTMTSNGLLHYNSASRLYYPTTVVKHLGSWIDDQSHEAAWITSLMKALNEFSGETVALAVQNDTILMYIRAIESDHLVRYHVREGEQRPLLDSSMGWLLMSRMDPVQIERIYRRSPLAHRQMAGDLDVFQKSMAEIRGQDYCYLANVPPNAGTVSMMLPATFNDSPIVIGVGGFIERIAPRVDELINEIRNQVNLHARSANLPSLRSRAGRT
ncbi:IclR family transcriptional regulator [Paraburkholderia sp.]|uniref:IclR family transcriptional regulator n=1 Tax=Paraburkholderia sp. TaxID=1926495 RepID=UPI0039E5B5AF